MHQHHIVLIFVALEYVLTSDRNNSSTFPLSFFFLIHVPGHSIFFSHDAYNQFIWLRDC